MGNVGGEAVSLPYRVMLHSVTDYDFDRQHEQEHEHEQEASCRYYAAIL
jgi:hypothetical protein